MKRMIALLVALVAMAGMVHFGTGGDAPRATAQAGQRSKVALVNIAKVLRNFKKASTAGKDIADKRAAFIVKMNEKRAQIAERQKAMAAPTTPQAEKDRMEKEVTQLTRDIQDLDREAQKALSGLSNDTIVRVYNDIKSVIDAIAVANGMELVLCYPDASLPTEENTAAVAQLKLQTPAAMPFYQKNLDITDAVIQTLNLRNPVAEAPAAAPMQ